MDEERAKKRKKGIKFLIVLILVRIFIYLIIGIAGIIIVYNSFDIGEVSMKNIIEVIDTIADFDYSQYGK